MPELKIKSEIEKEFHVRLKPGRHTLPSGEVVDLVNMTAKQIRAIALRHPHYFIPKGKKKSSDKS